MPLLPRFFSKKKKAESVILIDISADGVWGAYAHYQEKAAPTILYTRALPFSVRKDEPHERAMLRALKLLGNALITEGAPVLNRMTGSGSADMILVSISAPWQETTVHTEHFDSKQEYTFTKGLVDERLQKLHEEDSGEKLLVDESIIGIRLNGYTTANPYGKRAHRATVLVLMSLIERGTAHKLLAVLEELFHTKKIFPIASDSLRYQAVSELFPHDKEGVILDATSPSVSVLALIRKGALSIMTDVDTPPEIEKWVESVTPALGEIAKQYPLPRTVFLIATADKLETLRKQLCVAYGKGLWLSDNSPKVVPVLNTVLTETIHVAATAQPNIILLLMAYYYEKKRFAPRSESVHNS